MDKAQLKQRLVGAIVLVGLGVIFIPMILSPGSDEPIIAETNIPAKPERIEKLAQRELPKPAPVPAAPKSVPKWVDESLPQKKPTTPNAKGVQPQPDKAPVSTSSSSQAKTTPEPAATKPARAWVVQVASFSERNKALTLRDRLRKAQYPTFVESIAGKQGTHYRVRVGPVVKRNNAEQWKKTIAKKFKVKDALVMRHP